MLLIHLLIGAFFAAWFILSAINQFGFRWFQRVLECDYFSLIPYWTFFAPHPGQTDFHIVYRDKRPDRSTTGWREVMLGGPRGLLSFIWNPTKRTNKVLADVAMSVSRIVRTDPGAEQFVIISFQYLLILNYLTKSLPATAGGERQFAIVETAGFFREGAPRVVLRSDFHSMDLSVATIKKERVLA